MKTRLQVQSSKSTVQNGDNIPDDSDIKIHNHNERFHLHQNHHYTSTFDAIQKIVSHDGITGLYAGMPGSLLGVASTNFAYFYWYTIVRDIYIASLKSAQTVKAMRPPGTVAELSLGAVAGALAQLFTIPVAVVTIRQQTRPKGKRKGLVGTGREIVNSEDGWSGLWRGLKASLVLVANPAITYAAYQRLRELLFAGKASLRPWEAFGKLTYSENSVNQNFVTSRNYSLADGCSPGRPFQSPCDDPHSAFDSCKGWPTVTSSTSPSRKTLQYLYGSNVPCCRV